MSPSDSYRQRLQGLASPQSLDRTAAASGSPLLPCPQDPAILACRDEEGRALPLHSLRDPRREAEAQAEAVLADLSLEQPLFLLVVGIASGFHLTSLVRRLPAGSTLVAVDGDAAVLRLLDDTGLRQGGIALRLIAGSDLDAVAIEYKECLRRVGRIPDAVFLHPASRRLCPGFDSWVERLRIETRSDAMDQITVASFAEEWIQNGILNLRQICANPGVPSLRKIFSGRAAFVLCAGPSLQESLPFIASLQDRALIIAVGTALAPALRAGIRPHLTIAVDSDPKVYLQFQRALPELPGYLVASQALFPPILDLYPGRLFTFGSGSLPEFSAWLARRGHDCGGLNTGGTVALSALDLAYWSGCSRVAVFGLDLAFAEDGTTHAAGSMYDQQRLRRGLVRIPGNWEPDVPTTRQFATYVQMLENYLQRMPDSASLTTSVSSGGARIRGLSVRRPAEFFAAFSAEPFDALAEIAAARSRSRTPPAAVFAAALKEVLAELEQLGDLADQVEKRLGRAPGEFPELRRLEKKLRKSEAAEAFLSPVLQRLILGIEHLPKDELTTRFHQAARSAIHWIRQLLGPVSGFFTPQEDSSCSRK
ncbi:MAG: hypothetical protein RL095_820 [Verrucomicrobiota bacterium]|jgi:hypothetical protein